jgi:tetratricopeptide (TPR) repeat protein
LALIRHENHPALILKTKVSSLDNIQVLASGLGRDTTSSGALGTLEKIHVDAITAARDYDRHGNLESLSRAIARFQSATDMIAEDDPRLPGILDSLGTCLSRRFERAGNIADMDDSIARYQAAVKLMTENDPDKPNRLRNLGDAHERRFQRFGNLADINEAIMLKQAAVDHTPDDHPLKADLLSSLGSSLSTRFERLGNTADLDGAIKSNQAAVNLIPDGHPNKPVYLNNLGHSFNMRFQRLGNLADIDEAIKSNQAVVDITPDGDPDKPTRLNSLGHSLRTRFERLGNLADLNNAISLNQAAVNLTTDNHPSKAMYLNNLGDSLDYRFQRLGNMADLDDSITSKQAAVNLTPDGHFNRTQYSSNLAKSLRMRFERLGNPADINTAIKSNQVTIGLCHPEKPPFMRNLGISHRTRFLHTGNPGDAAEAIFHLSASANSPMGPPTGRLMAAKEWISTAALTGHSSLLSAYECALNLMPKVAWLGLPIADRHQQLVQISGITRDAAAAAISLEQYDKALEWLERGRSIVWTQVLQLRTPVDDLRDVKPDLADRFAHVSEQMAQRRDGISAEGAHSGEDEARRYRALTVEWEWVVEQIRSIPGFEDFLRPPSSIHLMKAVQDGPVIVLNVAEQRCDALALIPGLEDVIHIPLPRVTLKRVTELANELKEMPYSGSVRMRGEWADRKVAEKIDDESCKQILAELWNDLVKPVLESLAFLVRIISSCMSYSTDSIFSSLIQTSFHASGGAPLDHLPFSQYTQLVYMNQNP